nr:medium-chain acyl-CoA ligase ACSF2, mitochondrial isoform X2 [Oryctolagus cuniculus]
MAVYAGMLRLGRLYAGSPGVLGARAVLPRGWQEARLQGVRSLSSAEVDRTVPLPIGGLSYVQGHTKFRLINKTVGQCLDLTAQRVPDQEALVVLHENIRLTFAQLKEEVDKAASGLLSIGLCKGDRLGMWGPNSYAWVLMQLATAQAGIILVSVNPAYQAMELEYVLKKVGCKALVFPKQFKTQQYYNILKQICPELEKAQPGALKSQRLPDLTTVISVDAPLPGTLLLDDVVAAGSTQQHLAQLRHTQQFLSCHDPVNIQFTSGTTGSPKGATLSHYNIVNNSNMIGERLRMPVKMPAEKRVVLPSPLYHCLGSVGGTMVCMMHGATLLLSSPSFDGKKALEAISREKCDRWVPRTPGADPSHHQEDGYEGAGGCLRNHREQSCDLHELPRGHSGAEGRECGQSHASHRGPDPEHGDGEAGQAEHARGAVHPRVLRHAGLLGRASEDLGSSQSGQVVSDRRHRLHGRAGLLQDRGPLQGHDHPWRGEHLPRRA